jgi:hypothetical protein
MKLSVTLQNNLSETKILQWNIGNSNLAIRWANMLKNKPRRNEYYHSEFDWYMAGYTQEHFDKIVNRMSNICKKLNLTKGFDIPSSWFENLTRESLNQLHLKFHSMAEDMPSDDEINQLNYIVHTAESCMSNIHWKQKFSNLIMNFNVFDCEDLVESDYLEFTNYSVGPGTLILSYATIGKNLFHCHMDNDLELVKNHMVRPKLTLTPAVNCYIGGSEDRRQPARYYKWCDDNNILDQFGYDCHAPLHSGGHCIIGVPIDWDADTLTEWLVDSESIRVQYWELQD